jgi:hypothetical protein
MKCVFFRLTEELVCSDDGGEYVSHLNAVSESNIRNEAQLEIKEFYANAAPGSAFRVQHDEYILAFALTVPSWMQ